MNIDRLVFAFAGIMILLGLGLSQLHSTYWLLLTAFVGLNMLQAAFTGFCPLARILKSMGKQPAGPSADAPPPVSSHHRAGGFGRLS